MPGAGCLTCAREGVDVPRTRPGKEDRRRDDQPSSRERQVARGDRADARVLPDVRHDDRSRYRAKDAREHERLATVSAKIDRQREDHVVQNRGGDEQRKGPSGQDAFGQRMVGSAKQ